jgi:hypothetical protein
LLSYNDISVTDSFYDVKSRKSSVMVRINVLWLFEVEGVALFCCYCVDLGYHDSDSDYATLVRNLDSVLPDGHVHFLFLK